MGRACQRGLSLMELVVVFALLGLFLTTALDFLVSMFRNSGQASIRHGLQTKGFLLSEEIIKALRTTGEPGLALHDDEDWTGFSVTGLETVTTTGQQVWKEELSLYYWRKEEHQMFSRRCPPLPTGLTLEFAPDRPPRPEPEQFSAMFAEEGRLLSDKVTHFAIDKTEGLVTFNLELREEVSAGSTERFSIQRELSFKS